MFAASKTAGAVSAAPPASSDPQFNYVSLLLNDTGTNGQQNNTFLDSSSNNFTITRNGTPTQGSVTPYWPDGQWSNFFSGSGQYLTTSSVTFAGDFTVEGWVFINNLSAARALVQIGDDSTSTGPIFFVNTSGKFAVSAASNLFTGSITIAANTWVHLAVARSGSTIKSYVNGVLDSTITNSTTFSGAVRVGAEWYAGSLGSVIMNGYISNLRLVTGTAVYTSNFTPSTTPLTAVSGTSLLTCQSNRFKDNSSNNFAITVTGTPTVQAFEPFEPASSYATSVGGSGYFSGTGQSLSVASNAAFGFGTGDFTIEMWVNTSDTSAVLADWRTVEEAGVFFINATGVGYYDPTVGELNSGFSVSNNAWNHVALTRSSGSLRIFINGVQRGSTWTVTSNMGTSRPFYIGVSYAAATYFAGYMSNIRVVKGTAVYTSTFTPPTSPVTAITGTSLLLNCTNAGIYDAATLNDLVTVGNAQVSTAQAKFGSSSMAFDGTGDYLTAPATPANRLNVTGNFTVEFWVRFNTVAADQRLIAWDDNTNGYTLALYTPSSGALRYYLSSTGTSWNIASGVVVGTVAANTWYHLAFVRVGSVFTPYLNGVAGTSTTNSSALFLSTLPLTIGAVGNGASPFNGYIEDLRITKGYARYTANFTPPTAPFPTR